ncbi:MAG TPA: cytochrome ubiquinol oxidase subunit I [Bacteroidales bacterium]|nr:cytochrome ubiquinol oxidase subunit I [Bacteroidales bacterium]
MHQVIDPSVVDWSRAQFALTAMYHWIFVPLTLGLSFIIAILETLYVKTGNEEWKRITKFWMTLFGINFAIGVATGIILEFEFGTNWSNYSWFVGDIFGAPLAIEGILAFFLESTFIAVMFFGWNKVSKKFHLLSTWLVAFGSNLSALWILVANAWMQNPVGMHFNPDTARNEMVNFWDVLLSPFAINKFMHTITSGYVLSAIFVIGISSWYVLKKQNVQLAKRSMLIAAVFGLLSSVMLIFSGDGSAKQIARVQPMKFAAFEGLYDGEEGVPLITIGVLSAAPGENEPHNVKDFAFKIEIPNFLSYMAFGKFDAYIPGINDLVNGNPERELLSVSQKMERGREARETLARLKEARDSKDMATYNELKEKFSDPQFNDNYFRYFGYGFLNSPQDAIPSVPVAFYSFHIMVVLGFYFVLLLLWVIVAVFRNNLENNRFLLRLALWTIPLTYLASQSGWVLTEMGRQPWVIQDLLPTMAAISKINASSVQITFFLFATLFTILLTAEISIMVRQIKNGPK